MTASAEYGFGDLLRRARRATGLSQEELAERAGISARAISDLERGVNRVPRRDTLELLAGALGLTEDERAAWERSRRGMASRAGTLSGRQRAGASASSLPAPLTPLVGREREIAAIAGLLCQDGLRLLTVTGPGGVGKTRLSIATAHEIAPAFADGAWFVDVSALRDPEFVLPAIAATLGSAITGSRSALEDLTAVLMRQHRLLVIDNLEQVVAVAPSLEALLTACPRLSILATSRVPLHVPGEQEFPLAALGLADREGSRVPEDALRFAAVRLFVQRTQAIRPDFQLSDVTAPVVASICARLDGLPLAIELAAARTRTLSPQAILQWLDRRLDLLVKHGESIPARQRTMRGAIQWSYELLSPEQQRLFRGLSAFTGGATLETIEAVLGDGGQPDLLDSLEQLVEHNLIQAREQPGGTSRYVMLGTIHDFSGELLRADPDFERALIRHADYYLDLATTSSSQLEGRDRHSCLDRLDAEHDNFRSAIGFLYEQRDIDRGLALVEALSGFWFVRGHVPEGRAQTDLFLALTDDSVRTIERGRALRSRAELATFQGDIRTALESSAEALSILEEVGTSADISEGLFSVGIAAAVNGDSERANGIWRQIASTARKTGDAASVSRALSNLAVDARVSGDLDTAVALLHDSLDVSRAAGADAATSLALGNLASIMLRLGNATEAGEIYREILRLERAANHRPRILAAMTGLAEVAAVRNELWRTTRLLGAADALREAIGGQLPEHPSEEPEHGVVLARASLGDDAFDAAWTGGHALSVEQAIEEALEPETVA